MPQYAAPAPHAPLGTLLPGTAVQIGEYTVTIQAYLSQGGFAHVYRVSSAAPINGADIHVLKRVAVPDKDALRGVRWEVDVMKQLRGHRNIVNIIEASASPLPGNTGFQVFILMELCPGGGIIDMLNTRLQNRLTEPEILTIFSHATEAICHMHNQSPPLVHRDLKVENILLSSPTLFKLCDFGSTTKPMEKPLQNIQDLQALELDLNKHTTLQYRAPEMCDVWARKVIGTPADIWALGVLLYKLCYYTTPFEDQGPLAILNVQYKFPSFPAYSQDIKTLIASLLVENQMQRPTAWQLYEKICRMRGTTPRPENRPSKPVTSPVATLPTSSLSDSVLVTTPISNKTAAASSSMAEAIVPGRRGRPFKPTTPKNSPGTSAWTTTATSANKSDSTNGFADSFAPDKPSPPAVVAHKVSPASTSTSKPIVSRSLTGTLLPSAPQSSNVMPGVLNNRTVESVSQPIIQQLSDFGNLNIPGQADSKFPSIEELDALTTHHTAHSFTSTSPPSSDTPVRSQTSVSDALSKFELLSASRQDEQPTLKPKPVLVNRSSQTSPTLMEGWSVQHTHKTPTLAQTNFAATPSLPPKPMPKPKPQTSIDLMSHSTSKPVPVSQPEILATKPTDLLGDDEGGMQGLPISLKSSPQPDFVKQFDQNASNTANVDSKSSDEDEGPEDYASRRPAQPQPTYSAPRLPSVLSDRTSTPDSPGNFDIGPALASIRKFAPASSQTPPPEIIVPKPKKPISNLVGRYESIAASTPTSQRSPEKERTPTTKAGDGSFENRFPGLDGLDSHLTRIVGQTPPSAPRNSFTPTRKETIIKPRPVSMYSSSSNGSKPPSIKSPPVQLPGLATSKKPPIPSQTEEEEEKFEGVRNMKAKWETQSGLRRGNSVSVSAQSRRTEYGAPGS